MIILKLFFDLPDVEMKEEKSKEEESKTLKMNQSMQQDGENINGEVLDEKPSTEETPEKNKSESGKIEPFNSSR